MQRTLESLDQWKIPFAVLAAYWIVAALAMRFVYRRWCSRRRAANPSRFRFWFALSIAIIFTPSLVGDFWLFAVPAPAILGLLWFIPVGFLAPVYWLVALVYYVVPMTIVFAIAYAILRRQDHHLQARPSNQAMQLTAPRSVSPLCVATTFNLQPHALSGAVADLVSR